MIIRCDLCRGKKRVIGLGMIEKKCQNCKGVGHLIKDEEDVLEPGSEPNAEPDKTVQSNSDKLEDDDVCGDSDSSMSSGDANQHTSYKENAKSKR